MKRKLLLCAMVVAALTIGCGNEPEPAPTPNPDDTETPQEPAEPIAEKNKAAFESVRDRIIAELNGVATPDMIITDLAQLEIRSDSTAVAESVSVDKK